MSAITAITAQNTLGVSGVHAIPPAMVAAQIDAVAGDIGVDAAKTGMLGSAGIVEAVAAAVDRHGIGKLVVDPVMIATSGATLSDDATAEAMVRELFPRAMLVTPNLPEASHLLGWRIAHRARDGSRRARTAGDGLRRAAQGRSPRRRRREPGLDDLLMHADGRARLHPPAHRHPQPARHRLHAGCRGDGAAARGRTGRRRGRRLDFVARPSPPAPGCGSAPATARSTTASPPRTLG